jgi:hypothetical protein
VNARRVVRILDDRFEDEKMTATPFLLRCIYTRNLSSVFVSSGGAQPSASCMELKASFESTAVSSVSYM